MTTGTVLLASITKTPEERLALYRRLGCTYKPTEAEIQTELRSWCTNNEPVTEYSRMRAVAWILHRRLRDESEERDQRRERDLARHYRERDAGRDPLRAADLLSVLDGAERVGVKPEKVHHWIRKRELRVWGIPKHYRVSLTELYGIRRIGDGINGRASFHRN
jgi:hypothetical protein